MKKFKFSDSKKSRRSFFKKGIFAGLATLFSTRTMAQSTPDKRETIKLLTSDGKLVEIEKKHLPPKKKRAVSNKELFRWKFGRD